MFLGALPALACSINAPPPDPAHEDRVAYAGAAARPGEPNACADINAVALQDECLALAAGVMADQGRGQAGLRLCQTMNRGPWQDECVFLVVERGDFEPAAARKACDQAGRFSQRCRGHMLRRLAAGVVDRHAVGAELTALAELEVLAGDWAPRAAPQRAREILAEHLAGRDPDAPFSRRVCGAADRSMCVVAFQYRVQMVGRAQTAGTRDFGDAPPPWLEACPPPVPMGRSAGLGLPTWQPEVNDEVQEAWQILCAAPPPR